MRSKFSNNGCFDFCDKYTLPMYLECAYNWYLIILENRLYKIFFFQISNQTISLSCNESWKLSWLPLDPIFLLVPIKTFEKSRVKD